MTNRPVPGVSRGQRITGDGLSRLEKHLKLGNKISRQVLRQWQKRYGDAAGKLLKKYGYSLDD